MTPYGKITSLEKKAWEILESLRFDVKFFSDQSIIDPANVVYAQFPVERTLGKPFLLDFALAAAKIDLEVDGEYWHQWGKLIKVQDKYRDEELRSMGWKILRLPEKLVDRSHIETLFQLLDL